MKLLSVLKKDLLLLLRDRGQLAVLFLTPLAFIIPISLVMPENGYMLASDFKPRLPVANYDLVSTEDDTLAPTEHAQALWDFLGEVFDLESGFDTETTRWLDLAEVPDCAQPSPACDELVARALVEQSERETALIVPEGFSTAIDAGEHVTVTFLYDPVGDAIARQVHEAVVQGGATQLSVQNQVFSGFQGLEELLTFAPQSLKDAVAAQWEGQPSAFGLKVGPDTYQQTIPGYTVMFVFFIISFLAGAIRTERNSGTFRRLLYLPVGRSQVLAGKLLAALVVGVAQVALMFAVGHFVFGMSLGQDPLALVVLTVAVVSAAVGMGLAAAAFNLEAVLSIPLIAAALIGGCMFPSDWLPEFIRTIARTVPHYWSMSGYQDILVRGYGLMEVLPSIVVLLGFAAVFFVIAVRRLEFE
jgi:ABC-2 type transport system permease protein